MLTSWTRALLQTLEARRIDALALAEAAGIPLDVLNDPEERVPQEASSRLWRAAVEATGDAALGLDVSRYVRATTFHGLGQAFLASPCLEDALRRTARLSKLVYDTALATTALTDEGVIFTITWGPGAVVPEPEGVDAIVAAIVRSARFMLDRAVNPRLIRFERPPPPPEAHRRFEALFRCPLAYSKARTDLVYDLAVARREVPTAHLEVAQQSESAVAAYLARISTGSTVDRVRRLLAEQLPQGEPGVAAVARSLDMSARTLQRQLEEEGTTFRDVLNELRREMAQAYLRDGRHSIAEVTYLLGFSETAAFSRAFKRWTGIAPSRFV